MNCIQYKLNTHADLFHVSQVIEMDLHVEIWVWIPLMNSLSLSASLFSLIYHEGQLE